MRPEQDETKLQREVQEYVRSIGGYCCKMHGSIYMRSGIPDILCCIKGRFVGIETKDGNNTLSQLQMAHGLQIMKAKGIFIKAYSVEDVRKGLEKGGLI